jgi:hypothetical protein
MTYTKATRLSAFKMISLWTPKRMKRVIHITDDCSGCYDMGLNRKQPIPIATSLLLPSSQVRFTGLLIPLEWHACKWEQRRQPNDNATAFLYFLNYLALFRPVADRTVILSPEIILPAFVDTLTDAKRTS